jgi:hypothetical protein
MKFVKISSALLIFAAIVAGSPAAQAVCTNASLKGVYGILSVGLNNASRPEASIDQIIADGAGHLTGSSTKSTNGTITTFTFTGTYTVASNCTGTTTFTHAGQVEHDNFVLNNANLGAFLVQTDSGHTQSSVAVAEGTATCTDLGVKHAFAFRANGTVIGIGQVAYVGRLVLNGTGKISGTATVSQDGVITSSFPLTGTYQIKANCTGSVVITGSGLPSMNANLVVVNGGRELMVIETDANTIISGLLQM